MKHPEMQLPPIISLADLLNAAPAAPRSPIREVFTPITQWSAPGLPEPTLELSHLRGGTDAEIAALATTLRVTPHALRCAYELAMLYFGEICGHHCWVLLDVGLQVAEARRMDGLPFPAKDSLGERRAHVLKCCAEDWPVGVPILHEHDRDCPVMMVQGAPDYLAALHLLHVADNWDVMPVAMLGPCTGQTIHPMALSILRGRPVRIYPHSDTYGEGRTAALHWATQLQAHGCTTVFCNLNGELRADGQPAQTLSDLIHSPKTNRTDLIP